jgi:hypothetical protein
MVSPKRREEILDALRRGTVPQDGLDVFAVGLDRFEGTVDAELRRVQEGGSAFKAIRGDYGCGKTFFSRWMQERARRIGFATTEVQISETETPLHRLETVYRRMLERLATSSVRAAAFRSIVDAWFYTLEEDVLSADRVSGTDDQRLLTETSQLMEKRLEQISQAAPSFSAALRGYREALAKGDTATAEGLVAWVSAQPNVGASVKRTANLKGEVDHFAALSFLQGLLVVLRDSGHAGLVIVLDEVETLQRVRTDAREYPLATLLGNLERIGPGHSPEEQTLGLIVLGLIGVCIVAIVKILTRNRGD